MPKIDTVEQQRKELIEEVQTLPADALQKLTDFVTGLRQNAEASKAEQFSEKAVTSPYQSLEEFGLIGCGEGPFDLSTNYRAYLADASLVVLAEHLGTWANFIG